MTYSLTVFRRTGPRTGLTIGWRESEIKINAANNATAETEALRELSAVAWEERFAELKADQGRYFRLWK